MARKVKVIIDVDPEKETTIRPLGAGLAEKAAGVAGVEGTVSATGSSTGSPQNPDSDVDVDVDA